MSDVLFAFLLTLFAGLSTGFGSLIAFFSKRTNPRFLSVALGFSAGVMIYVSMVEILVKAQDELTLALGESQGMWITMVAFFGGMGLIALIDRFVPERDNPHELLSVDEIHGDKKVSNDRLMKMGVMTAVAIAIHNFPEGLATFIAALQDRTIAIPIAIAIAIHNIPEGIAVSIPIYYATGSRKKAFFYSFLSGLAEPFGALIGYLLLMPFMSPTMMGVLFAGVAGIMVFISLDELLPTAQAYGEHHYSIYGLIAGMMVMAISLVLMV